jgi:hypothetical protein
VNVEAQLSDLAVLYLVEAPNEHVGVQRFGGEESGHLFADDEVVMMSQAQGTFDGVTIGERDVCHALCLGLTIEDVRVGVRFAQAELTPHPLVTRR